MDISKFVSTLGNCSIMVHSPGQQYEHLLSCPRRLYMYDELSVTATTLFNASLHIYTSPDQNFDCSIDIPLMITYEVLHYNSLISLYLKSGLLFLQPISKSLTDHCLWSNSLCVLFEMMTTCVYPSSKVRKNMLAFTCFLT